MKNLFTATIFSIILAGVSFAQSTTTGSIEGVVTDSTGTAKKKSGSDGILVTGTRIRRPNLTEEQNAKPRIVVLEFASEANTLPANGTQTLQTGIVETMKKGHEGSKGWVEILSMATPDDPSNAAYVRGLYRSYLGREGNTAETAAKLGKAVGATYVMTGRIYTVTFGGTFTVDAQIVEVASGSTVWTGTVRYSGTTTVNNGTLLATGAKSAIQQLTATLKAADL